MKKQTHLVKQKTAEERLEVYLQKVTPESKKEYFLKILSFEANVNYYIKEYWKKGIKIDQQEDLLYDILWKSEITGQTNLESEYQKKIIDLMIEYKKQEINSLTLWSTLMNIRVGRMEKIFEKDFWLIMKPTNNQELRV